MRKKKPRKVHPKINKTTPLLTFYRKKLMYLLVVAALLVYFVITFQKTLNSNLLSEYHAMCNTVNVENKTYDMLYELDDLMASMLANSNQNILHLVNKEYEGDSFTPEILQQLNDDQIDNNTYYYLDTHGNIMSGTDAPDFELTDIEIMQLMVRKSFETDSYIYALEKCKDGYLIACMPNNTYETMDQLTIESSFDELIYDVDTGEIIDVSSWDEADEDKILDAGYIDQLYWKEINDWKMFQGSKIPVYLFSTDESFSLFSKNVYFAVSIPDEAEEYTEEMYFFVPCRTLVEETLEERSLPMLMLLIFAVFALALAGKIQKEWESGRLVGKEISLFRKFHADLTISTNVIFILLCITLLMIGGSAFLRIQWRFTSAYDSAQENLDNLSESYKERQNVLNNIQDYFEEELLTDANICCHFLDKISSGEVDEDMNNVLLEMKKQLDANVISICDENGTIIYSTGDYTGYTISKMEDDSEYQLWQLLNGEKEAIVYKDTEQNVYCGAVRRTDGIGIVMIERSDASIRGLKEKLGFDVAMQLSSIGTSDKLYVLNSDPEKIYRFKAGSSEKETLSNTLPEIGNLEKYCGISNIGAASYLVCGLGEEKLILYTADSVMDLIGQVLPMAVSMGFMCMIIMLLVLLGTAFYQGKAAKSAVEEAISEQAMGELRRKRLLHGVRAFFAAVVILMIADCLSSGTSIPYFLFLCSWKKGLNVFAFSSIIISLLIVLGVLKLMREFFKILGQGLPSHAATVMQMLNSVLSVAIVIWFIIHSFDELGVDMTTIVAGLGVTGLALGIGAKDTISDLVAGIFIILDGHVRVGDMIKANGFYGKVIYMGIRNTKIRMENQEISIHNSYMTNVINYSKDVSKVCIDFVVSRDVSRESLEAAINQNAERFCKACDGKLLGNVRLGDPTALENNGNIRYQLLAPVDEVNREEASGRIREIFRQVAAENDIQINPR